MKKRWVLEMRPIANLPWHEVDSFWFKRTAIKVRNAHQGLEGCWYRVVDRRERER